MPHSPSLRISEVFRRYGLLALLTFMWAILFWSGSGESRPFMDAMTYGALAKHILSTGDWLTLHYTEGAYADFYQHPPLGIWMGAIVFKIFGATDLTQKILPAIFAYASVVGIFLWGRRWRNEWWGFVAGLVLLTSTRFIKYSGSFMLDPILTAFSVWALYLACIASDRTYAADLVRRLRISLFAGFFVSLGFLTKGLPIFAPAMLAGLVLTAYQPANSLASPRKWAVLLVVGFFLGIAFPMGSWLIFADGVNYLQQYWQQSVRGRLGGGQVEGHFAFIRNVLKVYWPWIPFYLWGTIRGFGQLFDGKSASPFSLRFTSPVLLPLWASLAVVIGFSWSGHFLEHYTVLFYPFAAMVVAEVISKRTEKYLRPISFILLSFFGIYASLVAGLSLHVQGDEYLHPMRVLLPQAVQKCGVEAIHRLHISSKAADRWTALAFGTWYTPWDVSAGSAEMSPAQADAELLVARSAEKVSTQWEQTSLAEAGLSLYRRRGVSLCD